MATNVVMHMSGVKFFKLKNDLLMVSIWFLNSVDVVRRITNTDTPRIAAPIFKDIMTILAVRFAGELNLLKTTIAEPILINVLGIMSGKK